jgi:hypothetical protein
MNRKRVYVWQLSRFLTDHGMTMSGDELAQHLNRNHILTEYGDAYIGKRGTFTLIREVGSWLSDELGLPDEAEKVASAFVLSTGEYAYATGQDSRPGTGFPGG